MKKKIDIAKWERREIYRFFKEFDEPYYGITVDLDCTAAYDFAKLTKLSFFLYYLYLVLKAVNQNEAFKYRIEGDELYLYDVINGSATIDRDNGTFGFSYIPYFEDLGLFMERAIEEVIEVRMSEQLIRQEIGENIIHFSSLPWIQFTHVSHPRHYKIRDSIPKVTVGKYYMSGKKRMIPVSVHVHHAVTDGLHLGQFFDSLQGLFMEKNG
jgi:chloramphenicol O-acetyltransferase type A